MLTTILHPARDTKTRPPLVIAHGLFGSGRNWGAIARMLATMRDVVAVDMRNHGGSFRAASQSYADMAGDLAEVVASLGTSDLLGHSMGGKAAMQVALTQGHVLRKLVVADIAPLAYTHDQTRHIFGPQIHPARMAVEFGCARGGDASNHRLARYQRPV